jgi:6-phosphofructokinase 1
MKTLIVVSGGDAPGINATIARYTLRAQQHGDEVIGAIGGFAGVLSKHFRQIELPLVRLLDGSGGSYLPTSREPVLSEPDAPARLRAVMAEDQIDNILLFGGDGSLKYVLPLLKEWQIPVIALPTTIDNDVAGTERTLGFDTACNFAYPTIQGILATAHALSGRIFMVETLGGYSGYLALDIAFATGAHAVLIPEYDFDVAWIAARLKKATVDDGFALTIVCEGVIFERPDLPEEISRLAGIRMRFTRLGHAQRGGATSHLDRRLATEMAHLAYDAFQKGVSSGTVIVQNGSTHLHEGTIGDQPKAKPNYDLYQLVNGL